MVARAGYAVRRGIAAPEEILMLAFSKKAAAELSERVVSRPGDRGAAISSGTFRAFGLRVTGGATGRRPGVPDDLASDNGIGRLSRVADALRDQDPGFRRDRDLFRLVLGRHLPGLGDEPDPEAVDRRSGSQGFKTLAGEVVKSQEEVMIANWLFFNDVSCEYERPCEHDVADARHRQYQPDFFYPDADACHEHWALGPDDPLLQLAMAAPDSLPYAGERRLFYVALTRARRSVLLLTRAGHESPFLIELIQAKALRVHSSAGADITPVTCPQCKKRIMRQRLTTLRAGRTAH
jgi:hypothetical protein